jgi:hypothetical protein
MCFTFGNKMTKKKIIVLTAAAVVPIAVALLLFGLAPTRTAKSATWYISLPWGTSNTVALSATRGAGVRESVMYTKLDIFLEFVGELPPGSVLDHDAGCVVPASYNIGDETITVEALKSFCKQREITVHIYGSW